MTQENVLEESSKRSVKYEEPLTERILEVIALLQSNSSPKVRHPDYEDDQDHVEVMGAISCGFLERIHTEERLVDRFSAGYPFICIPKDRLAAYIDMLMTPPAIDLGLEFPAFSFPDEPASEDEYNHTLAEVSYLSPQFELFTETLDQPPVSWLNHYLDINLAARFLPLLKADDGRLLAHAPHFHVLLDYLVHEEKFAALLSKPRGPYWKELSLSNKY